MNSAWRAAGRLSGLGLGPDDLRAESGRLKVRLRSAEAICDPNKENLEMSQPPASSPSSPPEWDPPAPTEGPLASGSGPVLSPAPPSVAQPSKTRKLVPVIVGVVLLAILGAAAKLTVLDSDSGEAPGKAEISDAFTPIDGYKYAELPADAVEQAKSFLKSNPEAADAIGDFDIRQVKQDGSPVGAVIIFGVDPDVMGDEFRDGFASGFQGTGNVDLNETTVDGTAVFSVSMPGGGGNIFFDDEDGLIFFVQGSDQGVADDLTGGLIKDNL